MTHETPVSSSGSATASNGSRAGASLLGSKSLWTAMLVTILGAASWVYSAATGSAPPATPENPNAVSTLSAEQTPASERFIDKSAPRAVRYGLSFIGAFFIAYLVKKVIKSVLIVAGLVIAAIAALKYFGLFEYDWNSAQQQVEQGVELAKQESGRLAKLATEYLPSSLAGGVGAIMGAKRG